MKKFENGTYGTQKTVFIEQLLIYTGFKKNPTDFLYMEESEATSKGLDTM